MKSLKIPLILISFLWTISSVANSLECKFYSKKSDEIPKNILPLLLGSDENLIKSCRGENKKDIYFLVSSISKTPSGFCHFTEVRVPEKLAGDESKETIPATASNASVTNQDAVVDYFTLANKCPDQGDDEYFISNGLSDDILHELFEYWERMNSSANSFEKAIKNSNIQERSLEKISEKRKEVAKNWGGLRIISISKIHIEGPKILEIFKKKEDTYLISTINSRSVRYSFFIERVGGKFEVVEIAEPVT